MAAFVTNVEPSFEVSRSQQFQRFSRPKHPSVGVYRGKRSFAECTRWQPRDATLDQRRRYPDEYCRNAAYCGAGILAALGRCFGKKPREWHDEKALLIHGEQKGAFLTKRPLAALDGYFPITA
jgi:hypothetical protein